MTDSQIAHLLRRATPAAHPHRLDALADVSLTDAIDRVMQERPAAGELAWVSGDGPPASNDEWGQVARWWVHRMARADAGVADRMAWFWHTIFTTADEAFDSPLLTIAQLEILYRHGMGDLPTLLHEVITSGAMLRYLDAAGSQAANPNENLARELMELYTIGPDNYTEDDVRAAARALAGWEVEDRTGTVEFNTENAFVAPLLFLGEQARWSTEGLIDRLANHPATAVRLAAALWRHLVGTEPTAAGAEQMGAWWTEQGLDIAALVEQILGSSEFTEAAFNRPRTDVEWVVGALSAIDPDSTREPVQAWELQNLGQRPFDPPSPEGWPEGDYWLTPGMLLPRLRLLQEMQIDNPADRITDPAKILARLGLPADDPAGAAIRQANQGSADFDDELRSVIAWQLAIASPTFQQQ